jgi:hypothetical protein
MQRFPREREGKRRPVDGSASFVQPSSRRPGALAGTSDRRSGVLPVRPYWHCNTAHAVGESVSNLRTDPAGPARPFAATDTKYACALHDDRVCAPLPTSLAFSRPASAGLPSRRGPCPPIAIGSQKEKRPGHPGRISNRLLYRSQRRRPRSRQPRRPPAPPRAAPYLRGTFPGAVRRADRTIGRSARLPTRRQPARPD